MNIEDLSPCIDCKTKGCGLIDGNECDKCRTFLNIKRIVENIEPEEKRRMSLYDYIMQNTYTCDICKSIIFPEIITFGDNGYAVLTRCTQIRGGIGNAVIHGHVCDKCVKERDTVFQDKDGNFSGWIDNDGVIASYTEIGGENK